MGKQIIDLIGELVSITGNSTVDGIIFTVIAAISASVAFGIVGMIFSAIGFDDADLMSDVHWIVRVVVFVGLTGILVKIAQFINWLCSFEWWVYLIVLIVIIAIIFAVYYIKHLIAKKKAHKKKLLEESKNETSVRMEEKTKKD